MAYLQKRNAPRMQRMCGYCGLVCSYSYLFCSECASWMHTNCDTVEEANVTAFQQLPPDFPYICRKCRCEEDGNLNFTKMMQRLHKAAVEGYKKLKRCVKRESLFLEGVFIGFAGVGSLAVDFTASLLLKKYFNSDNGVPAVTSSLDHVLFRAVSLAVCAKDSLAIELRARCCIEMVTYENYYRYQKNHEELARYAPEYCESCIDCALITEGSSLWTMSALASVVRRPILSVYPHVNGASDPLVRLLNTTFRPRNGEINNQVVRILWSSDNVDIGPGWKPNHFVPIFDQQVPETAKSRSRQSLDLETSSQIEESDSPAKEEDLCSEASTRETIPMEKATGGEEAEYNKFMDVFEAYEKITTAELIHSAIPRGVKENVWFLIDNSHNVRHPERRNTFFDDCGVWDSKQGSVAKSYLLLDDSEDVVQCTLKLHNGVYQKCVKNGSKTKWIVLDPQPDPNKVVVCHRYYAFLKRCTKYRRRIMWFDMPHLEDRGSEVALVEYLGVFPGFPKQPQGTSKRGRGGKSSYVRTDPKLLEEIATQIRSGNSMKPMKMYKEIQKKLGPECTLRDARQIRNLKYSVLKRLKKEQGVEEGSRRMEVEVEGNKIEVALPPISTPEVSITDENGAAVMMETMTTEENGTPIKFIIQQGEGETMMESYEGVEGVAEGSLVQMEDGQQAITLINTDANGVPDPSTQTIIMVNNIKDLEAIASGEVIVSHAPI